MKNNSENFGKTAGKIWKTLDRYGALNETDLIKKNKLNYKEFYAGIGWLARENKICKKGTKYQLGETNLTDYIGSKAGKIWNTLNSSNNLDILTIAEISQIELDDTYYALGWLARENKIKVSTGKEEKYNLLY